MKRKGPFSCFVQLHKCQSGSLRPRHNAPASHAALLQRVTQKPAEGILTHPRDQLGAASQTGQHRQHIGRCSAGVAGIQCRAML